MAGETVITVIGNLTADPELRFTPSGAAVANFTVASTPRQFDRQSNEWKDGETLFMRCAIWRDAAENVAESLTRGSRVIVSGRLKSRSWDDKESGQKRTATELDVEEVGPSLKYATAKVNKTQRGGGGGVAASAATPAKATPVAKAVSAVIQVRVAAAMRRPMTHGQPAATRLHPEASPTTAATPVRATAATPVTKMARVVRAAAGTPARRTTNHLFRPLDSIPAPPVTPVHSLQPSRALMRFGLSRRRAPRWLSQ